MIELAGAVTAGSQLETAKIAMMELGKAGLNPAMIGDWRSTLGQLAEKHSLPEGVGKDGPLQLGEIEAGKEISIFRDGKLQEIIPVPGGEGEVRAFFARGGGADQVLANPTGAERTFAVNQNFNAIPTHEISDAMSRLTASGAKLEFSLPLPDLTSARSELNISPSDALEKRKEVIGENRENGRLREEATGRELEGKYPKEEGFSVSREEFLRNEDGCISKDLKTGEARRVDFVVFDKNGNAVEMVETTSVNAQKGLQLAKEARIRDSGGNYIRMPDGNLTRISETVTTRLDRRA